ncbi:hypothetical protein F383_00434 [Gossypium arboreum]|nr:hypothetical protein F383_32865 [Gossypium arboreum]KHG25822.1 hypothetical protein F383_00434 [Gossypium arboreum]
MNNVTNY